MKTGTTNSWQTFKMKPVAGTNIVFSTILCMESRKGQVITRNHNSWFLCCNNFLSCFYKIDHYYHYCQRSENSRYYLRNIKNIVSIIKYLGPGSRDGGEKIYKENLVDNKNEVFLQSQF